MFGYEFQNKTPKRLKNTFGFKKMEINANIFYDSMKTNKERDF